jgi:ribose transport system permease protein
MSATGAADEVRQGTHPLVRILRDYAIVWVTTLLFVLLTLTTENFATATNLRNILDQQATVLIVAAVTTLTVISGGFDVSLSAVFILSPLVALRVENATGSLTAAVLAGLAAGLVAGALNGLVVAVLKINSFIATLATSFIFFGLAYIVSDKSILRPTDLGFRGFATTKVLGLNSATWVALVIVALAWFILERTRAGRYVFASGGNPDAARLSGVRVPRVLWACFATGGLAAGLAGTIQSSQSLSAQASDDFSFVFAVIAAVVVGGTSIAGGQGAVWRTVVGVLFIAILVNGFNLNGIDPVVQRVIQGLVILVAVGVDAWTRSRTS